MLAGWLAGVLTPLLEICSVQDYCIRPGTSSTVPLLSQSCREGTIQLHTVSPGKTSTPRALQALMARVA